MAPPPLRRLATILGIPRSPSRRARWAARLIGPAVAVPLAAAAAVWLATDAVAACAAACPTLVALVRQSAPVLALGLLGGLLLGLLHARPDWVGRLAGWLAAALALALPLATALPVAATLPHLLGLAGALGGLSLALVSAPTRLVGHLLTVVNQQRHQWWRASLRAARLTRRTLGLGVYRQLCVAGHIRVPSGLYPGRVYLVPRRTSPSGARTLVEEHGRVIGGLCLRPRQPLPDPEEVVAHVLLLRGDERAYLTAANFFPYDTALTPQATARRV